MDSACPTAVTPSTGRGWATCSRCRSRAIERATAHPDARYDLGCLYIGVNDVRALDFDLAAFTRDFAAALAFLTPRCERTLTLTVPLDLGRPRAGAKVADLNAAIERVAAAARRARGRPVASSARATT